MISRLKSLELHGYKTFASRFSFEFPGRITAIVGPNGSGKSNIADAIRWVLGEQSYSLLRGRKTEDMIFSGSEQRPRASMASAAITFDNDDGWLPIDFSEVSIARRAYRDGNNEYVLNGQRVRLKETSELLAQSGLAERTYTIIGQGLVDAALSLKPEERRRFFEEAAGIGLYRSRREESLNRLEATRRNLERVQDILSELEPRLRSLEKQAARVIEYERIKADLQALLREWYGYHFHRTQQEIRHAREVLRARQSQLSQARKKLEEVDGRVTTLRESIQMIRAQLNEWHARSAELHSQREQVNRSLAVLDERQRSLHEQKTLLTSDLVRLQEEEKAQRELLTEMETERERLKLEVDEARSMLDGAKKSLAERDSERARVEKARADLRKELLRCETRQVELRAHQKELAARIAGHQKSLEQFEQTRAGGDEELRQTESHQQSLLAEQSRVEAEQQELEDKVRQLEKQLQERETRRKEAQERLSTISTEEARLRAKLAVLEQAQNSASGLNQGSQAVLQAAKQGKLPGVYHSITARIEVPEEYETAIAALLGENLDAVLLPSKTSPEPALDLLSGGEHGRALLVPFDWLRRRKPLKTPKDADCFGRAVDLIRAPEDLQPFLEVVLGSALIVRDRRSARRIVSGLDDDVQVVTLTGEVFYASGAVLAGKDARAGLIARPRQIRELKQQVEELAGQAKQVEAEADAHRQEIDRLSGVLQEKHKKLREESARFTQISREVQQASLALEQARQKQRWQLGQMEELKGQINQAQDDQRRTGAEIDECAGKIESLDLQERELAGQLEELPVSELQQQVVHWNTQAAVTARSAENAERRVREFQQTFKSNLEQQETLKQRVSQIGVSLTELDAEKARLRESESSFNRAISELREKIDPAEQELAALDKQYEGIQMDYSTAQVGVTAAERNHAQAQLELTRGRETLESLRRRIEDDFGLVQFEYQSEIAGPTPLPLEGMVEQLPVITEIPPELEESINRQRGQLRRMGAINPEAQSEYRTVKERRDFLVSQVADLRKADEDLRQVISELDELMKREFRKTFEAVAVEFREMFTRLFGGGHARLVLEDEDDPAQTGIDIEARLPGRREQGLSLLSGGERSLTAVALIFSLLKVSPTPFCVLDEVDAMLDEANVGRFCELLVELSQNTQFIVITHNRNTVQVADVIYGVTMGKDSASQVISLKLDEVGEELVR